MLPNLSQLGKFPPIEEAMIEPDGLLCFGGELSTSTLISAYKKGIFPWYNNDEPILWWSPSKRMVLFPTELHISRSFAKAIKKHNPKFYWNRNFLSVISHCAHIRRKDNGTWIQDEMITAYCRLFELGHAFSLEVELNGQPAGGLYGIKIDRVLCGESMYSLLPNGSKYALLEVCQWMIEHQYRLLDCQLYNQHLDSMGARLIPRQHFIQLLTDR